MFRVMNEFKKVDSPKPNIVAEQKTSQNTNIDTTDQTINTNNVASQNGPVFFQ